mmetsp:Transcript_11768/g.35224  ORF Transcript_11768/g.35224 Transcript_11768/m.35224 type:complete len:200 (-) Transcript_11768:1118-1717(-)
MAPSGPWSLAKPIPFLSSCASHPFDQNERYAVTQSDANRAAPLPPPPPPPPPRRQEAAGTQRTSPGASRRSAASCSGARPAARLTPPCAATSSKWCGGPAPCATAAGRPSCFAPSRRSPPSARRRLRRSSRPRGTQRCAGPSSSDSRRTRRPSRRGAGFACLAPPAAGSTRQAPTWTSRSRLRGRWGTRTRCSSSTAWQ